jgi:hypothetical protein
MEVPASLPTSAIVLMPLMEFGIRPPSIDG